MPKDKDEEAEGREKKKQELDTGDQMQLGRVTLRENVLQPSGKMKNREQLRKKKNQSKYMQIRSSSKQCRKMEKKE